MKKLLLSTLLLLCSICGFAYDVKIAGYAPVGTYNGYPLFSLPNSGVITMEVTDGILDYYFDYINIDGKRINTGHFSSYSISMSSFPSGKISKLVLGFNTTSSSAICYINRDNFPSHQSTTLQIPATSPQHWESSRNDGATWTVLPNSASTKYTEADPERGKVLYRVLQGDGTYTDILTINYYDVVPSDILALPATSTKTVDESVTFTLDVEDDGYTYQWMHNGKEVKGATQNTYTISEIKAADAGTWHCVVSNPVTVVNSTNIELTVNKCAQTIDFPEIPAKTYGDEDFTLPEKTNKGQTIVYQSTNQNVATVSGNMVTIKGCGETTIVASQAGSNDYLAAATVTRTLTVNKRAQTITFEELPAKTYEDLPFTLSATSSEGLTVSYQSINTEVATIDGSTLTIVGAGTTEIIACQEGDATHYAAAPVTRTLTVNRRAQTITMGAFDPRVYGDAPIELNQYTDKNLEIVYTSDNEAVASVSGHTVTIKHPGMATITANQGGTKNYLPATEVKQVLTVQKAMQQITLGDIPNRIYGDDDTELPEKTDKGLAIAYTSDNEQVATIVRGHYVHIEGVGTANITATQAGDEYYSAVAAVTLPFTVSKAYQTITFPELPTCTYGTSPVTLQATTNSSATIRYESSDARVATIEGNVMTITGAGKCYVTAYADGDNNYYGATPVQRELTVQKAGQSLAFEAVADKVYGDAPFTLLATSNRSLPITYTSSAPSKVSISGSTATIKGAGTVTITAKQEGTSNYEPAEASITVVVNKAVLQAKADDQQREYGEENPALTITYAGFKNGDTKNDLESVPVARCSASTTSPVGTYDITIGEVSDNNYTLQYQTGTLTVTKAPLTVRPDDKSKVYGTQNPALTLSYSGFKNKETKSVMLNEPTLSTTAKVMSDAGTYPIVAEGGEARNYRLVYEKGVLTITKATLTIKLGNATREYGTENVYDITYTGFKGDDTESVIDAKPSVMTEATIGSDAGTYQMTLAGGYDNNYEFSFAYASSKYSTLTVTKAPLTVTADNKFYSAGSDDFPRLSMTFRGFRNGDTENDIEQWPNISCSATMDSPVGQYPITLSGGYDKNYSLTLVNGTLTITAEEKSNQTINFPELPTYVYGASPVTLTATTNSSATVRYESSDTRVATIKGNVMTITGAGKCYITAYADGDSKFYEATPVQRELTVQKASQSLTFEAVADKVYGDAPFTLLATSDRSLPVTYTSSVPSKVSVSGSTATIKGAGTVTITAKQEGTSNYEPAEASITVVVDKAVLQVRADDKQREYGEENPALTITYAGFKNGDTKSDLANAPVAYCSASKTSHAGTYDITINDVSDSNYALQCQAGTLTVTKAPLTVTADDKTYDIGSDEFPRLTMTFSGFKNADTEDSVEQWPSISCSATMDSPVGQYPITLSGGYDKNYFLNLKNGTLTIVQGNVGVGSIEADGERVAVYSLSGQFLRMVESTKPQDLKHLLQPGVYIIGGRKVLVK